MNGLVLEDVNTCTPDVLLYMYQGLSHKVNALVDVEGAVLHSILFKF